MYIVYINILNYFKNIKHIRIIIDLNCSTNNKYVDTKKYY